MASTLTLIGVSPRVAGGLTTLPVETSNSDPWHGQTMSLAGTSTRPCSPRGGDSVVGDEIVLGQLDHEARIAAGRVGEGGRTPTGTWLAAPIAVPPEAPAAVVVVAPLPAPVVVVAPVPPDRAAVEPPGLFTPPTARPSPAAAPAATAAGDGGRGDRGAAEHEGAAVHRVGTAPFDDAGALADEERAAPNVARRPRLGGTSVLLVVAADPLDELEADRDHGGRPELVLGRHPRRDDRVE